MMKFGCVSCVLLAMSLLAGCGGDADSLADHNGDGQQGYLPSSIPSLAPSPYQPDATYATFELYALASGDVSLQAQLSAKPLALAKANTDYIQLGDNGLQALWASVGESINQMDLSDDLFRDLADATGMSVQLLESLEDTLYFNSLINAKHAWYGSVLPYVDGEPYFVTTELSSGSYLDGSQVTLPRSFTLDELDDTYSRSADAITLSWNPIEAGLVVDAQATVECLDGRAFTVSRHTEYDEGFVTFDAGVLDSDVLSGTCFATFIVVKRREGTLDSYLRGGVIAGNQVRLKATVSLE
ncbi:hypothetical protein WKI13_17545 [Teredinibacter turnerae]|uniref:hypothetical protein n=1 Tax=Teredinibacter turnerae TaxID=2426 RepID=UPI0003730CDB|nr:hypothetical protein [Teredinibacter turnerae]